MNFEDARAAIYGRLATGMAATYPLVSVEYENRVVIDLARQVDPWISCEIVWSDGDQVSIEDVPMIRYHGAVYLASWVKEGGGTATPLAHLGYLAGLFKTVAFGGVNTQAPMPMPKLRQLAGWEGHPLRISFWFDQRG